MKVLITLWWVGLTSVYGMGGEDIDISKVPHTVNIKFFGFDLFTGAILTSQHVATSAFYQIYKNGFSVHAGSSMRNDEQNPFRIVKEYLVHPYYNRKTGQNDFGLMILQEPLIFSNTIQPVTVSNYDPEFDYPFKYVSGWTWNYDTKHKDFHLKGLEVVTLFKEKCSLLVPDYFDPESMFCAVHMAENGEKYWGYAGSPMAKNGKLYGMRISSSGSSKYVRYSRMSKAANWYRNMILEKSS